MVQTSSIQEFHRLNHADLIRFLQYKGIFDYDIQQDLCQSFYLRLQTHACLDTFDPLKGSFDSYICKILSNLIADYYSQEIQARPLQESDGVTETDEVLARIRDFRSWIERRGGRQSNNLLRCLRARIRGDRLNESSRSTYYRYLQQYQTKELL